MADEVHSNPRLGSGARTALASTIVAIAVAVRTDFQDKPVGYKGHKAATPYRGWGAAASRAYGGRGTLAPVADRSPRVRQVTGRDNAMDAPESGTCPELSAVIVYFRTPGPLATCLRALCTQSKRPGKVVVVDNSSAIDGRTDRPAGGKGWKWLCSKENLGFAAGCNAGAASTEGEFLLFVNADLELSPDACALLLGTARDHPDGAVVAPRIHGRDGQVELNARSFPSPLTGIAGRRSLFTKLLRGAGLNPPGFALEPNGPMVVDWVSGACMLIRRSAFEAVGGFDESYWMYWEDADLCKRLAQAGWRTRLDPRAVATHLTGSSGTSARTIRAFHASAYRYYSKHIARGSLAQKLGKVALDLRVRLVLSRRTWVGRR